MNPLVIAAGAALIVAVAIGTAILIGLASGPNGPRRFPLHLPPGNVLSFLTKDATWAATAQVAVKVAPDAIWSVIDSAAPSNIRATRLAVVSLEERIVDRRPSDELTIIGTGISVPLIISSFAQRFTIHTEGTQTVVRWTVAFTPKWVGFLPLRWTGAFARPAMKTVLRYRLRSA